MIYKVNLVDIIGCDISLFYFVSKPFQNDKILIKIVVCEKKRHEMKNISFFTCRFVIFVL